MRLILAAILGCVSVAAAQTKPQHSPRRVAPATTSWPVESVKVEGLHRYSEAQVLAVLGIRAGQPATAKQFTDARDRLLATGAFEGAAFRYAPAPSGKGYAVTFEVTEAGPQYPVRFEDLGVPTPEVEALLRREDPFFGATVPGSEVVLARYTQTIQHFLAGRGSTVKVVGKLEPDDTGKLGIVFRSSAARPAVARVQFTGNSAVANPALENAINTVAVGVPYREPRFRQMLDAQIRPLYESRGRVRVSFPEIQTQPDKDVKGVDVLVKVEEGPVYNLGTIDVQGSGLSGAELKKVAPYKTGEPFTPATVDAVVSKVEGRLRREGYMHVASTRDRRIDDKAKKLDVVVKFVPGDHYTFGVLSIEGLDLLSEPQVRKMWGLKAGESFNSDYPDYFLSQVRDGGILENLGQTKSVLKTDDETKTVDVTLIFKGAPPKPKRKPGELPGEETSQNPPGPFTENR